MTIDTRFEWLLGRFEPRARLLRTWLLKGGVSAEVTGLEIAYPNGRTEKLVARRHGAADRARNPNIAADEFALLRQLHAAGIRAPAPRFLDPSGEFFDTPVLVVAYVEGTPGFIPVPAGDQIEQFAAQLARIHALDLTRLDVAFLPDHADAIAEQLRQRPATVDALSEEARIWDVLAAVWPILPRNPPALLHGDYWPGNTLWEGNRLAAVVDWEDAAQGDPLADVANARLELLWAGGAGAAEQFTQHYLSLAPLDAAGLPYWELCAALRPARNLAAWGLDAATEPTMRAGLRWFIGQAIARLPGAEYKLS
jgi:aminoglycoside phosphotransferase (APT) family kinase protein